MASKASSRSSESRSSHVRHRRHYQNSRKLWIVLHSLNTIFSFTSISILISIIPLWNGNFFHSTGLLRGDWPDALLILPLFITLLSGSNYLVRLILVKRASSQSSDHLKSRQITNGTQGASGTNLCIALTTLVLLLTFLILAGVSGLYRFWRPAVITSSVQLSSGTASSSITLSTLSLRHVLRSVSSSTPTNSTVTPPSNAPSTQNSKATFHSCTLANVFTRRCNPTLYLIGDLQITAICTASLVWLLNLIIFVLQVRDHQYQKRKHQRSLRAKARSKLDLIEDEMSRIEKGPPSTRKKIHHDKQRCRSKSPSASALVPTEVSPVSRPVQAHTTMNALDLGEIEHPAQRPKQHYYDPNITPSRSRSTCEPTNGSHTSISNTISPPIKVTSVTVQQKTGSASPERIRPTLHSNAVDEARRKVKPAETMRDWLAGRC